jgi:hypothetical protein
MATSMGELGAIAESIICDGDLGGRRDDLRSRT